MIRVLVASLLALVPIVGTARIVPPATPHPAPVVTRTLGNGLTVVVVEDHAAAVVQTAMWYRFGSLAETRGKTGLAHALEHMMFRGTRDVSAGGFDDIAARLGATVNANTSEDYTRYTSLVPADKVDLALRLEADRMRGLLLRQSDWIVEKGAVLAEYDGDASQPLSRLAEAVRERLYAGSPYARGALGVRTDVVRATAADLRRYYDAWYRPGSATLVVTGDIVPDAVFASAAAAFGAIPAAAEPPAPHDPPPAAPRTRTLAVAADYPYAVIDLAYRIPGDLDRDAASTQLFATLVESERSSFYRALVPPKLVLAYNAFPDTSLHHGIFHVVLIVTPGVRPEAARDAFEAALAQVRTAGVDASLLQDAKAAFARQAIYARDSVEGLGERYGYAYGVEGRDPSVDDRSVAALDPRAMNGAVRRYFRAPQIVGRLPARGSGGAADTRAVPAGRASDDFSGRTPAGPVVLAPWVRAALAEPPRIASRVHPARFSLPNGMRILVQPVHQNPTVFVSGAIALSPAFDPPALTGLGGIASSLISYGSERYDFDAQRRVADALGAEIDLGAAFSAHGMARDLDRMLAVLADGVRHPAFPHRYVALVTAQELASISERDHSPDYRADRAIARMLYPPGDPALRQESQASVRAIDRSALRAYAARYFRPDRTWIVVAGDVDPEDVRAAIERAFGTWANRGGRPDPHPPALPPTVEETRYVAAGRPSVSVRMAQRSIARGNPDFSALTLLNGVLGGGGTFDTRLMHEIRERRGLVYTVSSTLSASRDRGTFEIDLSASPANVRRAVALAREQVTRLRRELVGAAELARAKRKLVAGAVVGESSTQTVVSRLENIAMHRLAPDYYLTLGDRYGRITALQMRAVARRYLRPAFGTVYEGPVPPSRRR